ncbi:MAG: hypothetical protein KatS3mg104_1047 [Phycisphaerae bacterium]|jgi:hypothetical protein|nr:MAG: hypothetical protein KatS3mg104_1047 [Phycisphaerae bacterium]
MNTRTLTPPGDELQRAKARLIQTAREVGPSALVRRHPWSVMIGTVTGAFALTAIVKLLAKRPTRGRSDRFVSAASSRRSGSFTGPLMQSLLHMGLPIIQSQFTRLLNQRRNDTDSIRTLHSDDEIKKAPPHALG